MSPRYLIHIGYAKAASSFLQSSLFSGHHSSFQPLGSVEDGKSYQKSGYSLFFDKIGDRNAVIPFAFDASALREELEARETATGTITAISNEAFAGHPYSGGIWAPEILRRIKDSVPNPKILIVIREQRDMALSTYADYLDRSSGLASLEDFMSPKGLDQAPSHMASFYAFSPLVAAYRDAFGPESVLTLPMESIISDPDSAVAAICAHCGVREAEGWKVAPSFKNSRDYRVYAVQRLFRWANILGTAKAANGHAGWNVAGLRHAIRDIFKHVIPRSLAQHIRNRDRLRIETALAPIIAEDNVRLQSFVSQDLAALGYMMPERA